MKAGTPVRIAGGHLVGVIEDFKVLTAEELLVRNTEHRMVNGPVESTRITGRVQNGEFVAEDIEWQEEYRAEDGTLVMTSESLEVDFSVGISAVNVEELFKKR